MSESIIISRPCEESFLTKKKQKETRFLMLFSSLLTSLIVLRDLFDFSVNKYIFVLLIASYCLVNNYRGIIYMTFFLMPILNGLPGNYLLPIIAFFLMIKNKNVITVKGFGVFFMLAIMELAHFPFYGFAIDLPLTIGYLSAFLLLCSFVSIDDDTLDYRLCLMSFCFGTVVFLLVIYGITVFNQGSIFMFVESQQRLGFTHELLDSMDYKLMMNANPNELGAFAVTCAAIVLTMYRTKHINTLWMIVFLVVSIFVGAFSISRTFFLCLGMLLVLNLFIVDKKTKGKRKGAGRYLLIILVVALIFYEIISNDALYGFIFGRFSTEDVEGGGGRMEIINMYNEWLKEHPVNLLFGTGAVHYVDVTMLPAKTHNAIQQIVVAYGLVGLLFFIYITIMALKKCYRNKNIIYLIPFIIAFVAVQASRILNPWVDLYLFFAAFYVMKLGRANRTSI